MPASGVGAVLVGTSVLAGALLATPAPAATKAKPVCRLVSDARGDAAWLDRVPGGATDDLLSADLASDGRTVTAVFRMADVQQPDPVAPLGHAYAFYFRVRGAPDATQHFVSAYTHPTGTRFVYGHLVQDTTGPRAHVLGAAKGTVSVTKDEVRVHAPAAGFRPPQVRRGATLTDLHVSVYRWWGVGVMEDPFVLGVTVPVTGTGSGFDEGEGNRYVVGTPSCVKPGT